MVQLLFFPSSLVSVSVMFCSLVIDSKIFLPYLIISHFPKFFSGSVSLILPHVCLFITQSWKEKFLFLLLYSEYIILKSQIAYSESCYSFFLCLPATCFPYLEINTINDLWAVLSEIFFICTSIVYYTHGLYYISALHIFQIIMDIIEFSVSIYMHLIFIIVAYFFMLTRYTIFLFSFLNEPILNSNKIKYCHILFNLPAVCSVIFWRIVGELSRCQSS